MNIPITVLSILNYIFISIFIKSMEYYYYFEYNFVFIFIKMISMRYCARIPIKIYIIPIEIADFNTF